MDKMPGFCPILSIRILGDARRAAHLYGAAEALREAVGAPRRPDEVRECERDMARIRGDLGLEGLEAGIAQGRSMDFERLVRLVLEEARD